MVLFTKNALINAGGAILVATMFAISDVHGAVAENEDTNAPAAASTHANFRAVDLSSQTAKYVRDVAINNSKRKNIYVTWGGTESLRDQIQLGLMNLSRDYPQMQIVMIEGPRLSWHNRVDAIFIEVNLLPKGSETVFTTTQGLSPVDTARRDTCEYALTKFN